MFYFYTFYIYGLPKGTLIAFFMNVCSIFLIIVICKKKNSHYFFFLVIHILLYIISIRDAEAKQKMAIFKNTSSFSYRTLECEQNIKSGSFHQLAYYDTHPCETDMLCF